MEELKKIIREVPDFPVPGILFYDLTTLMKDREAFHKVIDAITEHFRGRAIDVVAGVESRGFIFAAPIAYNLGAAFVPVRKYGKLPAATIRASYDLEYGKDSLEIHRDAIAPGQNVLIVDDLMATGGTAKAVTELVEQLGGKVVALAFLIELEFLKGRSKLDSYEVFSLIRY